MRCILLLKRTKGKEPKGILSKIVQESLLEFEMCLCVVLLLLFLGLCVLFVCFSSHQEPGTCCNAAEVLLACTLGEVVSPAILCPVPLAWPFSLSSQCGQKVVILLR